MRKQDLLDLMGVWYWRIRFKISGGQVEIGKGSRISIRAIINPRKGQIKIGKRARIMPGAVLDTYNGAISIGHDVSLNYYSIVYGHGGVHIGDETRIAAHCTIIPANHIFADKMQPIKHQGESREGIFIGKDVWLGAGVIVLDGSNIADGCVIGANSTVSGETESYGVYVGSPARKIKERA